LGLDRRNYLLAQVVNGTSVTVQDVEIALQIVDRSGRRRQIPLRVAGRIGPGKAAAVATGIGPFADREELARVQAVVTRAALAD
jgi:hypothetical protein